MGCRVPRWLDPIITRGSRELVPKVGPVVVIERQRPQGDGELGGHHRLERAGWAVLLVPGES